MTFEIFGLRMSPSSKTRKNVKRRRREEKHLQLSREKVKEETVKSSTFPVLHQAEPLAFIGKDILHNQTGVPGDHPDIFLVELV